MERQAMLWNAAGLHRSLLVYGHSRPHGAYLTEPASGQTAHTARDGSAGAWEHGPSGLMQARS
eukprot:5965407-Lingulodinium_polyedra.AAC.1